MNQIQKQRQTQIQKQKEKEKTKHSVVVSGYHHYSFLLRVLLLTVIALACTVTIYQHTSLLGNHKNKEYTDFEIHKVSLLRHDDTNNTNNNNNNIIRNTTTKKNKRHDKEEDNDNDDDDDDDDDEDVNKTTRSSDTTTTNSEEKKKKDDDDDAVRIEEEDEDDTAIKKEEKKTKMEADNRLAREESERLHNINYRLVQERMTTRTTTTTNTTDQNENDTPPPLLSLLPFIPQSQLVMTDYFSATWFLSRDRFLEINYNDIIICEDAVWVCVKEKNKKYTKRSMYVPQSIRSNAKMTLDWTHFNVEHLSKYWMAMSAMTTTKPRQPDVIVPLLLSMLETVIHKRMRMSSSTKTTRTHMPKKKGKILVEPSSSSLSSLSSLSLPSKQLQQQQQQQQQSPPPLLVRRSTELEQTIAIIPFMPVIQKIRALTEKLIKEGKGGGPQMSVSSLAATLSSLWSIGVGRVVVVSLSATDAHRYTRAACHLLQQTVTTMGDTDDERNNQIMVHMYNNHNHTDNNNNNNNNDIATIGYRSRNNSNNNNIHPTQNQKQSHAPELDRAMEIAHVHVTDPFFSCSGKHVAKNVPRAAVAGLWTALSGTNFNTTRTTTPDSTNNEQERRHWLGTAHNTQYWKYLYLTEPDTIVNLNRDLVSSFREALDVGLSLFPHRIHPLPHARNLSPHIRATVNPGLYLPNVPPFHVTDLVYPHSDGSAAAHSVIESQTQAQLQVHNNNNNTTTDSSSSSSSTSDSDSDAQYIACCDAGRWWPGEFCWKKEKKITNHTERQYCQERWERDATKCAGAYWWSCGFQHLKYNTKNNTKSSSSSSSNNSHTPTALERRIIARHHNLLDYHYMTIQEGSGAVFGSSNHGRTCLPSTVPCRIQSGMNT